MSALNKLFEHTLKDIYNSEQQMLKLFPEMEAAARNEDLKNLLGSHFEQSKNHLKRLEQAAEILNLKLGGVVCEATKGLVKEASDHLQEFGSTDAIDAAIIASAQKNEHYEIANYGTALAWAEELDFQDVADLLAMTLEEEEDADDALSLLAEGEVNEEATIH